MKKDELDGVLGTLKPLIDDISDTAYQRRPDPAQIRASADRPAQRPRPVRRRRPVPVLAALAATATATAVLAAVALAGGDLGLREGDPTRDERSPGATGTGRATDARAFLLASAETIAKQAPTSGTCWYTRLRNWEDVPRRKPGEVGPIPSRPAWAYAVRTASTMEDWSCTLPGTTRMRFRSHGPLDVRVTFPTKKDEAGWRAVGSPPLNVNGGTTTSKPRTTTYEGRSHLVNPTIGSHEIEWKAIPELPATKAGLERHLRELWQQDREGGKNGYIASGDFCQYAFVSAWDLFRVPTAPGTRAALYRILADCPSLRATEGVRDRMGRPGTALTYDGVRLIVDPETAQFLAVEHFPTATGRGRRTVPHYMAYEQQGWVNKIGAVPGP